MARTIGRKYKNQIMRIVAEGKAKGLAGFALSDYATRAVPVQAHETWEGAFSEIERLIDDEIFKGGDA